MRLSIGGSCYRMRKAGASWEAVGAAHGLSAGRAAERARGWALYHGLRTFRYSHEPGRCWLAKGLHAEGVAPRHIARVLDYRDGEEVSNTLAYMKRRQPVESRG